MSSWASTRYAVSVFRTDSNARMYEWSNWRHLVPELDAILALSPAKAAIRSFQSDGKSSGWLSFGRMAWSASNNKKWTTRYRSGQPGTESVRFFSTEVWAPSWTEVERTSCAPDVFVKLDADGDSPPRGQGLVVAVRRELADAHAGVLESRRRALASLVPDARVSVFERGWAREINASFTSGNLLDESSEDLARQGSAQCANGEDGRER